MLAFFHCVAAAVNDLNRAANTTDQARPPITPTSLATETVKRWRDSTRLEEQQMELRQELEQAAKTILEEFAPQMRQIARIVAHDQPSIQEILAQYLTSIPERIRKKFSRVDDPTGTTVPPVWALRQPQDIIALLPPVPLFEIVKPQSIAPEPTSPIRFSCCDCNATLTITTKNPGDKVSCPNCERELTVPPRPPKSVTPEIQQPSPVAVVTEAAKPVEKDWRTAPPEATPTSGVPWPADRNLPPIALPFQEASPADAPPFAIAEGKSTETLGALVAGESIEVRDWRTGPPPVPANNNAAEKLAEQTHRPAASVDADLTKPEQRRDERWADRKRQFHDDDEDGLVRPRPRRDFEDADDSDEFDSEDRSPFGKGLKSVLVFLLFFAVPFTAFIIVAIQYWKVQMLVSVGCLSGALFSGIFGLLHLVISAKKRQSQ